VPDEKWGETPIAAVILREGESISAEQLRAWVNERVEARFQKISQIVFKDDFPRSVSGKTLKRVMREPFWAEQDSNI
jgi:acyl-CoA synthetase (AMP-forming)/AMP-acid ligase II